jgi:2-C-methyl-D-erythritol 4-phosphate cytidylyltransferase
MNAAIIVAAGQSKRMGAGTDKLFLEFEGRPVVGWTWSRFDGCGLFAEIILVVGPGRESEFTALADRLPLKTPFRLVPGGSERQDSVWNGVEAVSDDMELVAIQDGARPCTSAVLMRDCLEAARESGAAVAAQPLTDTIKESVNGDCIDRHLDRSLLWAVQTPQCFRLDVIRAALLAVREKGLHITDDTAACELIGQAVRLVASAEPNPKLTSPSDRAYLSLLLREQGIVAPTSTPDSSGAELK